MNRFKRAVLWAALLGIVLLILLSIYGAFLGAERAQAFFNSVPLACYWFALAALLLVGIIVFRRLLAVPSLLLLHLGCILVLAGGMWGSQAGQRLQKQLFGIDQIERGVLKMNIADDAPVSRVADENGAPLGELPFAVRLKAFRLDYYTPGFLVVQSHDGQSWKLPADEGAEVALGDRGKATIEAVYENFKLAVEDGQHVAYDAPGDANPALRVRIEQADGTANPGLVFANFEEPMFQKPVDFKLLYQRTQRRAVKDYVSEVEVVQDGQVVATKAIEVNHPLHYGGYHLYQYQVDQDQAGQYTVLQVVSDSGLNLVYGGYLMLVGGVFWHFWGRRVLAAVRTRHLLAPAEVRMLPDPAGQQG
jgi:hypothetical protein